MNCLFCKTPSDYSKSKEHIIPESLGNTDHVLPPGIVCDVCNNYFAVKIEKELQEQDYFKSIRHRNDIVSKKGNPIPDKGILVHPEGGKVDVYKGGPGIIGIDSRNKKTLKLVEDSVVQKLYIPIVQEPEKDNVILSRFIGKVAIEALAQRLVSCDSWENEVIYKEGLDPLREYVRYGNTKIKFWQYHQRRIYSELDRFVDTEQKVGPFEILHEYTFHYSAGYELFFVLAIMGIEYAINMGGPDIENYTIEFKKHNSKSFLDASYEKRLTDNTGWLY
jgi:hypothetical protein